jgi:hypothetical protein
MVLVKAQLGFQVVSFATPFMAWIINCALLFAWTLVHLGLKPLLVSLLSINHAINGVANDTAT